MTQQTELEISPREMMGKAAKRLRKAGIIPANIFGHQEPSQAVQLEAKAFDRLVRLRAATSIISLRLIGEQEAQKTWPGGTQTALIRHVQHDPRSGKVIHIDFFRVSLHERVSVKVPLRFVGEAPGVKIEGGVLLHLMDTLEIECAAKDIPEHIELDITPLTEVDSILHAGDIPLLANLTLITDPQDGVVKVAPSRVEKTAEEIPTAAAPEAEAAATKE